MSLDGEKNAPPELAFNVATFESPNGYRRKVKKSLGFNEDKGKENLNDTDYFLSYFDDSIKELQSKNIEPAAVIIDPIFSSSGVLDPPPNYIKV
jgi:4-aminobutyrate aminotransferase-like enzyme